MLHTYINILMKLKFYKYSVEATYTAFDRTSALKI